MGTKGKTGSLFFLLAVCGMFLAPAPSQREYLKTGPWYPADPGELRKLLNQVFRSSAPAPRIFGEIRAIIVPHAGYEYSGACAASAYRLLAVEQVDRIILLGPGHRSYFQGACVSSYEHNTTPLGSIPVDIAVTRELAKSDLFMVNNRTMQYEHSLENHLPLLQYRFGDRIPPVVPVLIGQANTDQIREIARVLRSWVDQRTLVVVSSDFTHYGPRFSYVPFRDSIPARIRALDMEVISFIRKGDIPGLIRYQQEKKPTICGIRPILVLMEMFADREVQVHLVDYFNSGDITGDYGHCVSYASIVVTGSQKTGPLKPEEQQALLQISRRVLGRYLDRPPDPEKVTAGLSITPRLRQKRGIFVTLRKGRHLRGCIGDLEGRDPLVLGVIRKTRDAALRDPRFPPVTEGDIADIQVEISVLTPLEKIEHYGKIRLGTDGVLIRRGSRRAVFLPQVATETGWDLEQLLSRLCLKGGLEPEAYRDKGTALFIFQVQKFGETE